MPDSRNHKPAKPVGSGPFITFCQWVHDELSRRYEDTDTVKWNITTRGISARSVQRGSSPVLPFQIYQSNTWLDFKVSTGYVITTGDPFIPTGVDSTLSLSSGVAKYYFVLTITPTTAAVSVSATAPTWAVDVVPIGWVDTNTYSAETPPKSVIYQFLDEDVFSPCVV